MTIRIIEGRLYCSYCEKPIDKNDIFKINEFSYQVICASCIDKIGISNVSYVSCSTVQKTNILNIMLESIKSNKTVILDLKDSIKKTINIFNNSL